MLGFKSSQMGRIKNIAWVGIKLFCRQLIFFRIPAFPDANVTCFFVFFFKLDYKINDRSVFSFFHLSHIRQCLESHAVRKKDHDQV